VRGLGHGLVTVCAALTITASVVRAESARIDIDRPSLSNSTSTVPPGALQIESGVESSRTRVGGSPAERQLSLDVTLRGLTERLEVRLDGEPLVVTRGLHDDTGNDDLSLQAKYRFYDGREWTWWPSLGVLPFVTFPIAHAPHGTNVPDFGLAGLASFDLPRGLSLDANAALGGLGVFFASAAERGAHGPVGVDAGVEFFLTRRIAFDVAGQTSLAGPGPDYSFRAGLSVRFGR
jgi:hypothetical protein